MKAGHLSEYFAGIASKRLSAVEADAFRSDGYDVFPYMGNVTVLLNFIDQLEKSDKKQKLALLQDMKPVSMFLSAKTAKQV